MGSITERVGQRYLTASGLHVYRVVRADAEKYSIRLEECGDQGNCWGPVKAHPTAAMGDGLFTGPTASLDAEIATTAITWLEG